jgi:hypothetical protein
MDEGTVSVPCGRAIRNGYVKSKKTGIAALLKALFMSIVKVRSISQDVL